MEKITFENNVTKANADTFNTMQDNIEEAIDGVVLYDNENGTIGNVSLDDNAGNYNYLEIYYAKESGSWNCIKIFSPNKKDVTLYTVNAYSSTAIQELFKNISISNTTIVSNYGFARNSDTSQTGLLFQENKVRIFKVIGYK